MCSTAIADHWFDHRRAIIPVAAHSSPVYHLHAIDVGKLWDDLYDEDDSDPEIPPPVPSDFLKNHGLDR